MNRAQTMTLKYHRSENQSKKPSQMHKHPASPAGTPRCALARPGARMAAVSWLCPRPCRGKGPAVSQASVAVSQQQCCSPRSHPPAPQRPAPLCQRLLAQHARSLSLPSAQRRVVVAQPAVSQGPAPCRSAPLAVSWAGTRARPAPSLPSLATIHFFCIAAKPAIPVTIQFFYRDPAFPSLQYPSNLTIQNLPAPYCLQ